MRKTRNQIREMFKSLQIKSGHGSFLAWLGRGDGKVIADDNNGVYIIDRNGNVQVVLNTKVPPYPFRLVEVGYISEGSKVLEVKRFIDAYPDNRPPAIPNHEITHEWGGVDTLWVRPEQIMVGLCLPDDTELMRVHFVGFVYYLSGFHLLDNFSIDMTEHIPTTGAVYALLQTDELGVVTVVIGEEKPNWQSLEYEDIPAPGSGKKPLVAIRLYFGQTKIWKTKTRSDIVDLRFSGYASGSLVYWDGVLNKPEVFEPDFEVIPVVVSEDLTYQVDGVETDFVINVSSAPPTIVVYINGSRVRQSEVSLNDPVFGFALDSAPIEGDVLEVDFLAVPLHDDEMNIITDDNGHIIAI